ncbi:uncharacterized protein, partial [Fopius arisanus]|uniref:Uncharacterized protein n=1 Tax=Fopius arisanus TaxID=64838 RepID=A0A9R1U9Q7_9HYME
RANKVVKRPRSEDQEAEVKDSLAWLKDNVELSDELKYHWDNTRVYRKKWLAVQRYPLVTDVLDDWPILKSPIAPVLIDIDFDALGITERDRIQYWDQFFTAVRNYFGKKSIDNVGQGLLSLIDLETTSTNGRVLCQLWALNSFCAPKGRIPKADFGSSSNAKRASILEAKESMLIHVSREDDIKVAQQGKIKGAGRQHVQPYLIVVGSHVASAEKFFVALDNYIYPVSSALKAIDTCFKIFHVLDAFYPPQSHHLWLLIQRGLYQFSTLTDIKIPHMTKAIAKVASLKYETIYA